MSGGGYGRKSGNWYQEDCGCFEGSNGKTIKSKITDLVNNN